MKKFFTLCAAFATLLTAEAAPQLVRKAHTQFKPVLGRQLTDREASKPAKVAHTNLWQHPVQASLPQVKRAPGEVVEYYYDELTYSTYTSDVWFTITTTDQAWKFYFDILGTEDELQMGKVYTLEDCDQAYTYLSNNQTYAITRFEEVAVELSMGADNQMLLEATCTTVDGQVCHLSYKALERPETFTEVAVGDLDIRFKNFTQTQGAFQFTGESDEYDLALCMASDGQIEGSWNTDNVFEGLNNYTYLYRNGLEVRLCDVEMQVASLGGNDYHIDARMYAYDGNVYILNHDYVEPTVKQTADLVATNLKLDASMFDLYMMFYGYGLAEITASNADYTINGTIISYTTIDGHYPDADHKINLLYITDAQGNKTSVFSGDFDVAQEGDAWTVRGKMLGWNSTEYNVDLSFTVPEIAGQASFTTTAGELYDFSGSLGAFQVIGEDEAGNEFSIVLNGTPVDGGHYTEPSAEYKDYNGIYYQGQNLVVYSADFNLHMVGEDQFTLEGTCQADDLLFTISISGTYYPEEEEVDPYDAAPEYGDVDVAYTLDEIVDYEISGVEGYAYLSVENQERMDGWACMIMIDGDELPAGEYPINDTFAPGTVQPGLVYGNSIYPTIYMHFDEEGYVTLPVWYCTQGTVTVDYDAEGNIIMECEAVNTRGVRIHVAVNVPEPVGIQQVATQAQRDGKFYEQNSIVIRSNGNKYNTFGQLTK